MEPGLRPGSLSWRLAALETLLDRACIAWTGVRAAGAEDEIAVIEVPATEAAALAALAPRIRTLGFRYTTIDLCAFTGRAAAERPADGPG